MNATKNVFRALLGLVFVSLFITSCQLGTHKDLMSGLSYTYSGLGVEEVVLSIDGQRFQDREFPFQSVVVMNFLEVNGFKRNDGKVFPGLSVSVTDKSGNVVLSADDLFAKYDAEGLEPVEASSLSSNITIGNPMTPGQTYHWEVNVWDKRGEGEIQANMDFTVAP